MIKKLDLFYLISTLLCLLISGYFIKRSLKLEADEAREVLSK